MSDIRYRLLKKEEAKSIAEIDPSQYIENAWRTVDGVRKLIRIDYMETGWPDGYDKYHDNLIKIFEKQGFAYGAFHDGVLVGFISIDTEIFGELHKYVLLDSFFVSNHHRGKGIGKKLFELSKIKTKEYGAEKFYICAGSAEDTIGFYKALGCIEAVEINQDLYQMDVRDMQLEYTL